MKFRISDIVAAKKVFYLSAIFFLVATITLGQQKMISGNIIDAGNHEPMAFVTIALKKQLIGTISNESGSFDLFIPVEVTDDTLIISSLGYKTVSFNINTIKSPLSVLLYSNVVDVKEIRIRPLPPTYYINLAMSKIKVNYPDKPFETEAYYREKILENKNLVDYNEAIFKSYYPNYQDTASRNQHQLLLYNQPEERRKIEFMKERQEKKNKKNGEHNKDSLSFGKIGGGPESILKLDIVRDKESFLDSTTFKYFEYSFAPSTTYEDKELMVIEFKSRRTLDHIKMDGKVYIDVESNAIVKIEYVGRFIVPILIQPILFLYGFDVDDPLISKKLAYQHVGNKWYPKNIQVNVTAYLTKKHWFKPNEHSYFELEGIFTTNKLKTDNILPIPATKRFKTDKKLKEQVYNDEGITWSGINIIKK